MLSVTHCLFSQHFWSFSISRVSVLSVQAEGAACKRFQTSSSTERPAGELEAMESKLKPWFTLPWRRVLS